ncbi:MAG TPA: hypothetical protein VN934_11930 [Candidatus Tumulicola sp.]|nr:hypothetical protein [Candidatus Tumulicola sp.]
MSFTQTTTASFTRVHALYLTSKLKTDLKLLQDFYGSPSDKAIEDYGEEIALYVNAMYLDRVCFGFKRNGRWIAPTIEYTAAQLSGVDHDPGRIRPGLDIQGASFSSYLWHSSYFDRLSQAEREVFKASLPVRRTPAEEAPVSGIWTSDNTYCAAGRALRRRTLS